MTTATLVAFNADVRRVAARTPDERRLLEGFRSADAPARAQALAVLTRGPMDRASMSAAVFCDGPKRQFWRDMDARWWRRLDDCEATAAAVEARMLAYLNTCTKSAGPVVRGADDGGVYLRRGTWRVEANFLPDGRDRRVDRAGCEHRGWTMNAYAKRVLANAEKAREAIAAQTDAPLVLKVRQLDLPPDKTTYGGGTLSTCGW